MLKCVTAEYNKPFRKHCFNHREDSRMRAPTDCWNMQKEILCIYYLYIPVHARLVVESEVLHVLLGGLKHVLCMQTYTIGKFFGWIGLGCLNSCMTCDSTASLKICQERTRQQLSYLKYNLILMLKTFKLHFGLYQADLH